VRGIEIPLHDFNIVALHIPKGWRNRENKLTELFLARKLKSVFIN